MVVSTRALLCALGLALALNGCTNFANMKDTPYGEAFRWQSEYGWTEQTILRHGWTDARARNLPPVPATYCYRTIGEIDCYRSPRPGQGGRLVGYFGPGPL